jgi:hypothetical protein
MIGWWNFSIHGRRKNKQFTLITIDIHVIIDVFKFPTLVGRKRNK